MEEEIGKILNRYPQNSHENLIPVLQEVQFQTGQLSVNAMQLVSEYLNVPLNQIYGVATFYNQFHFHKRGKFHIQVCNGTNCHIDKSPILISELEKQLKIKAGQTSRDGKFSLEVVSCLGTCGKSPVVCINGNYHSQVSTEQLLRILSTL